MKAERRRRGERKQGGKANLHKEQHLSEKRKKRLKTNHQLTNTEHQDLNRNNCTHASTPTSPPLWTSLPMQIAPAMKTLLPMLTASDAVAWLLIWITGRGHRRKLARGGTTCHWMPFDLICKCDAACGAHVVRKVRWVCKSSISSSAKSVVLMGIV